MNNGLNSLFVSLNRIQRTIAYSHKSLDIVWQPITSTILLFHQPHSSAEQPRRMCTTIQRHWKGTIFNKESEQEVRFYLTSTTHPSPLRRQVWPLWATIRSLPWWLMRGQMCNVSKRSRDNYANWSQAKSNY